MTGDDRISRALLDPATEYDAPNDVLMDAALSQAQKIEILRRWEYDASELSVAEEEGMSLGNGVTVGQVLQALHQLVPRIDATRTPPTKQGGLDRAAVQKTPEKD
ncbi:hypothetical protein [Pseudophaeobacter sp.]|uniref:hypothetical protein n=1 Tax=Pseudophaeobacter sp. TaxID=1971739 RepID=UPI003298DC2D